MNRFFGHTPLASLAPLSSYERGRRPLGAWFAAIVVPVVVSVAFACGNDTSEEGSAAVVEPVDETAINVIGDRVEISAWTRPSSEFTYDQFIAAGWKQYQIYDVDTLPNALEARYGFFNRKDVEIRRYVSHDDAMTYGVTSAQEALARVVHDGSGFASRRVYGGFLVVGNLLMMCEVSTDDCVSLIESVESTSGKQ